MGLNVIIVRAKTASRLTEILDSLAWQGLEFTRHDILSLAGQDNVFTFLGVDKETAKKIGTILNYVPDYQI